jgi:hypothetical protein
MHSATGTMASSSSSSSSSSGSASSAFKMSRSAEAGKFVIGRFERFEFVVSGPSVHYSLVCALAQGER